MSPIRPLAAVLLCLAAGAAAAGDARTALQAAFGKTLAAKSYRATMTDLKTGKQVSMVEFQAPDRYRVSVPGGPTSVIAGGNMYVVVNGQAMKVPLPAGMKEQLRGDSGFRRLEASSLFSDLGPGTVGAEPARKYHWVSTGKGGGSGDAWVSLRTGQVLQVDSEGKVRVRYSDFNSPSIRIATPD
jgi:outer membrane lipoprotein-sorting protein